MTLKFNFNQLPNFIKNSFYFKAALLLLAFIVAGNVIAWQTGLTNEVSKIFYWPAAGMVAGEYSVQLAVTNSAHPHLLINLNDKEIIKNHIKNGDEPWKSQFNYVKSQADKWVGVYNGQVSESCENQPPFSSKIRCVAASGTVPPGGEFINFSRPLDNDSHVDFDSGYDPNNYLVYWDGLVPDCSGGDYSDSCQSVGYTGFYDTVNHGDYKFILLGLAIAYGDNPNYYVPLLKDYLLAWTNMRMQYPRNQATVLRFDSLMNSYMETYDLAFDSLNLSSAEKDKIENFIKDIVGDKIYRQQQDRIDDVGHNITNCNNATINLYAHLLNDSAKITHTNEQFKRYVEAVVQSDGSINDRYWGGPYDNHNGLQHECLSHVAITSQINGGEDLWHYTSPGGKNLNMTYNFYSPVYQESDTNSDYQELYDYRGLTEMGYKFLQNTKSKEALSDGTFKRVEDSYRNTRFMRYAVVFWGENVAGAPPPPDCSCTNWQNQSCGAGGCAGNQMQQTRNCTPSGCNIESQCVASSSCSGSGDMCLDNAFENRKQDYFNQVINVADRTFVNCEDYSEKNGVVLLSRNNLWPLLEKDKYPQIRRCMIKNMLDGLQNNLDCWEEVDNEIHQKCGSDTVGILEESKLNDPDWYNRLDDTQGFFWSVQYDNSLIFRPLFQYANRLTSDLKQEIEKEFKEAFITGKYGNGCFQGATNPNQRIQSAVGIYLWLEKHPENRNIEFTYKTGSCGHYGSWEDFSCDGRNYTTGGKYNIWQFSQDYLNCVAFPNFAFAKGDYANEFDGSYAHPFFAALNVLYDLAQDNEIKNKAKMALEILSLDYFLDFGADQQAGLRGRGDYYRGPEQSLGYIWFGLSSSQADNTPAPFPSPDRYVSNYSTPSIVKDLIDISDEDNNYWRLNQENNAELNGADNGKGAYVTSDYALGGAYGAWTGGWKLNLKPKNNCEKVIVFTSDTYSTDPESDKLWGGVAPFYQYRYAAFIPKGKYIYVVTDCALDNDEVVNGWRFLKIGKAMAAVKNAAIETAREGVDYPSYADFKDVVIKKAQISNGCFATSRGDEICSSADLVGAINGQPLQNFPFDRIETDDRGGRVVDWQNNMMRLNKHSVTCSYDFNNWTSDCPSCSTKTGGNNKADFNCDHQVNIYDFGNLMSCWGNAYIPANPYNCASQAVPALCSSPDLTGDNKVDVNDLAALLSCWGKNMCGDSASCGNGICETGETATNCPADCGTSGPDCGNHICESGENNSNCAVDCPSSPPPPDCPPIGKEILAKSGSRADVQAAVDAAGSGDTVRIPAGSFSYGDEEVVINKSNITITGTGNQETILHRDVDAGWVGIFRIRGGNNITIQNLQLFGLNSASASKDDFGIYISGDAKNLRIANSRFQYMSRGIAIEGAVVTGVIDHNKFYDVYRPAIANLGYGIAPVGRTWTQNIEWGGPDALFIEDNEFYNMRHAVSAGSGMYYVFRHNHTTKNFPKERENDICWGDEMTGDCYYKGWQSVDSHGGGYSDDFGTRAAEIYDNTIETEIQNGPSGGAIYIRGGDAVIFNNTIKLNYNDGITLKVEGGADYQIHDTYIWNNTIDVPGRDIVNEDPDAIKLGEDYYLSPKPGYTAYTYPHPLTQCQTN